MGLKVCIVGLGHVTHNDAPWMDEAWEKWGLPWDEGYWVLMERHFEMHDMRLLDSKRSKRKAGYLERLAECPALYLQAPDDRLPDARIYPFDAVAESIGGYYWNSSIAYALALAIHEQAEEIAIFGVDMDGTDEYAYQKPNLEYLIGIARGKGIKVTIPAASPLCKFNPTGIWFYDHMPTYTKRYGWLG